MFLATLAEAASVFNNPTWLEAAKKNGEFLLSELRRPDGRWNRTWHADGAPQARHDALAGDHAHLVDAFTRLAEATGEARWIEAAIETADTRLHGTAVDRPDRPHLIATFRLKGSHIVRAYQR